MSPVSLFSAALCTLLCSAATAQLELTWSTIDSGGTTLAYGGSLELSGTLGQVDAGTLTSGSLDLVGGVWDFDYTIGPNPIVDLRAIPGPERVLLTWRAIANGLANYIVERKTTGSFAQYAVVPVTVDDYYSYLDPNAPSGIIYTYRIVESFTAGLRVPRSTVRCKPYSTALPWTMARVGPNNHGSINAAIAAAPAGQREWIVTVSPGSYPSFTVGANAPDVLRIMSDRTGEVIIDTLLAPVNITGRTATQVTELHGLIVGASSAPNPGVVITQCSGVVIVDSTTIEAGSGLNALVLTQSNSVAIQNCLLNGGLFGLSMSDSRAVAGRTDTTGVELTAGAHLTATELSNTGSQTVSANSQLDTLPGVMPDVELVPFTAPDFSFAVDIDASPAQLFGLYLAFENSWTDLPIEMVLLLDPTMMFEIAWNTTNNLGRAHIELEFGSAYAQLYGRSIELQAVTLGASSLRLSNVATKIGLQ